MTVEAGIAGYDKARALVVGASGRMAAEMLSRLGVSCSVADLFADQDTQMICEGRVKKLRRLQDLESQEAFVRSHEFVVFAGGLEGCAGLAEKLRSWAKPAFASPSSIKRLLNPTLLNKAMSTSGLDRFPFETDSNAVQLPLVSKSLCRSGSAKLHEDEIPASLSDDAVFQTFVAGQSISITFVSQTGEVQFLASTLQLTNSLSWSGSISGFRLPEPHLSQAKDFALALVNVSGIRGVFNVDFILDEDSLVPVDINPRIPGSAEVIGDHVMENHLRAFGIESLNAKPNGLVITGKLVVFNQSKGPLKFSTELLGDVLFRFANAESESAIADVPISPSVIEPGAPVLTVFACGNSIEQVQAKLRQKQSEILHRLGIQNTEIEA